MHIVCLNILPNLLLQKAERADCDLFYQSCSEYHCLNHIYSLNEKLTLRTWGHEFTLLFVRYDFNKENFIVRAVYNYI